MRLQGLRNETPNTLAFVPHVTFEGSVGSLQLFTPLVKIQLDLDFSIDTFLAHRFFGFGSGG